MVLQEMADIAAATPVITAAITARPQSTQVLRIRAHAQQGLRPQNKKREERS